MQPFLTTRNLVLRPFTGAPGDVELVRALDNDPAVMRYLGRPGITRNDIRERILPRLTRVYAWPAERAFWVAEAAGEPVGWFALRPLETDADPVDAAELGYRLRRSAWGRGIATEGSRALVRTGFADLGLTRVVARTMTVNRASRRVMTKAGLRYARTYLQDWPDRVPGGEHGDVEYALTAAAWRARTFPGRELRGVRVLVPQRAGSCLGSFADVTLDFRPGDGFSFTSDAPGLPAEYAAAVGSALRERLPEGPFGRWDVDVVLTAGRHHDVDSSEDSFRRAAVKALERAYDLAR